MPSDSGPRAVSCMTWSESWSKRTVSGRLWFLPRVVLRFQIPSSKFPDTRKAHFRASTRGAGAAKPQTPHPSGAAGSLQSSPPTRSFCPFKAFSLTCKTTAPRSIPSLPLTQAQPSDQQSCWAGPDLWALYAISPVATVIVAWQHLLMGDGSLGLRLYEVLFKSFLFFLNNEGRK